MNNYPVNQVFLGGDSMMNTSNMDIETQLNTLKIYEDRLKSMRNKSIPKQEPTIWDNIDTEVNTLSEEQKKLLLNNNEYASVNTELQILVQNELLALVKNRIENTEKGKSLLNNQLNIVKKVKELIIKETNKEMDLFVKFKEYSKNNHGATYEDFIKANM